MVRDLIPVAWRIAFRILADNFAGEDVYFYAVRSASFTNSFRWLVTVFRFAEKVERTIQGGRSLADYLSEDEMEFFVLPGSPKKKPAHEEPVQSNGRNP